MGPVQNSLSFRSSGDTGLTVVVGDRVDQVTRQRVMDVKSAIEAAALPGVVEIVPTYLSLLVHYDPRLTTQAALKGAISRLSWTEGAGQAESRRWVLPICCDADFAPDLCAVADWAGLTPTEVISDLIAADQVVYMLGFAPGQPYLGDLPDRLAIPRRKDPIQGVPAGSVLIATGKTVIYPTLNPTGWHVVGRTPVPLFEPRGEISVLLRAGDHVTFTPVNRARFEEVAAAVADGSYDPSREALA